MRLEPGTFKTHNANACRRHRVLNLKLKYIDPHIAIVGHGPYSETILKKIQCRFLQGFANLKEEQLLIGEIVWFSQSVAALLSVVSKCRIIWSTSSGTVFRTVGKYGPEGQYPSTFKKEHSLSNL